MPCTGEAAGDVFGQVRLLIVGHHRLRVDLPRHDKTFKHGRVGRDAHRRSEESALLWRASGAAVPLRPEVIHEAAFEAVLLGEPVLADVIGGGAVVLGHLRLADGVNISAASVVTRSILQPGHYTGMLPIDDNAAWEKNAASLKQLNRLRERLKAVEQALAQAQPKPDDA